MTAPRPGEGPDREALGWRLASLLCKARTGHHDPDFDYCADCLAQAHLLLDDDDLRDLLLPSPPAPGEGPDREALAAALEPAMTHYGPSIWGKTRWRDGEMRREQLLRMADTVIDALPSPPAPGDGQSAVPASAGLPLPDPMRPVPVEVSWSTGKDDPAQKPHPLRGAFGVTAGTADATARAPGDGDTDLRAVIADALRGHMQDSADLIERDVPFYADDADDLAASVAAALAARPDADRDTLARVADRDSRDDYR